MKEESYYIHTAKYRLEIRQIVESKKMEMVLSSKTSNVDVKYIAGNVPGEWMDGDEEKGKHRLRRFREIHIQPSIPAIRQHNQT
jgi:hypothetical protein